MACFLMNLMNDTGRSIFWDGKSIRASLFWRYRQKFPHLVRSVLLSHALGIATPLRLIESSCQKSQMGLWMVTDESPPALTEYPPIWRMK